MDLETAQSFSSKAATPSDVRYAIANDVQRGEFLILTKSKTCFVQAAGDTEPFFVEYYDDDHERACQCKSKLSAEELEHLLLKYLADKTDWQAGYEWQLEPERPWWKFW